MSEKVQDAIPRSFWIISGVALVWNLLGVAAFVMQVTMTEDALMKLPEAERMLYENIPAWATVHSRWQCSEERSAACCCCFESPWPSRCSWHRWQVSSFRITTAFLVARSTEVYGPGGLIMPAMVLIIGVLFVWYSRSASAKAWISYDDVAICRHLAVLSRALPRGLFAVVLPAIRRSISFSNSRFRQSSRKRKIGRSSKAAFITRMKAERQSALRLTMTTRGKSRLEYCHFPPLSANFKGQEKRRHAVQRDRRNSKSSRNATPERRTSVTCRRNMASIAPSTF